MEDRLNTEIWTQPPKWEIPKAPIFGSNHLGSLLCQADAADELWKWAARPRLFFDMDAPDAAAEFFPCQYIQTQKRGARLLSFTVGKFELRVLESTSASIPKVLQEREV